MNTKAIALFAVLAVALTGGFAIVGADAADGDDFTAEYTTDGLVYGVSATFDDALDSRIQWVGSIYDGETPVRENRNMTVNGNVLTTMWLRSALEAGDYTLVIFDNPKTVEYKGTFTVHEDPVVTFYVDGEAYGEPVTVQYGKTVEAPEMPVKVGYSFDGWYLSEELTPFDFSTPITEDTALYGSYVAIDYNVTLVDQDGKQIGETETANFGEKVEFEVIASTGSELKSVVSRPVIDDFVFDTETGEGSFTMPASNVTIVATMEKIAYTITFVNQDGKQIGETKTANFGEKVEFEVTEPLGSEAKSAVSSPVIEDFVFSAETCEGSFTMPASDVTITVTFELIDCTVTFYVDGEVLGAVPVKYGETLTTVPEAPAKVGSTFDGWYELGALEPFKFETPIIGDLDLYADYELNEYTVNVVDQVGNSLDDPQKVYYGMPALFKFPVNLLGAVPTSVTSAPEVKITYDLELGTGMFTMPAGDVTVTVTYTVVPVLYDVTVSELIENGTVTADPVKAEEGDLITITAKPDDGYQTVAIYVDGKPLLEGENTFLMPAKNVEVSAVFAEIPVGGSTVTYVDVNGVIETKSYEIGEEVVYHVTTVPEGMKLGYVDFEPWMAFIISQEDCTVEFTAVEGNYTATISYIAPFTVTILNQDGVKIGGGEYFAEDSVELDVGYTLGVEVESAASEPEIEDFECKDGVITFTMPAQDVTVTVTLKPIVPETVKVVFMDDETEVAVREVPVETILKDVPEAPVHEGMTFTGWYRFGSDVPYDFETMPVMENMTVYAQYEEGPITDKVTVTFYDITGEEVLAVVFVDAGTLVPADEIPEAPSIEGMNFRGWMTEDLELFDFETEAVEDDMDVYAFYLPDPVMMVSVTFMDGETVIDTKWVEIGDYLEEVPEAAVKEGFNFVGWCVNDIPTAIDFETTPIIAPMVVYATYIETPDIGEGFAILYHDMYQGKPVDIWWKGYASKDDRVMLANGMDATAIFMGWLAEDQETLFSWNAAYDLNDIERNDCLIYPASYGYPGTDRIYELNAIYALEIEWVSFDGETVLKTDEVIRGDYLEAPFDDGEMQDMLDDYKPSDEGYSYTWAGWNVPGVGTYTSEDVEFIKANGSWRIVATYEGKVNEYDITFNWHDGTSTIRVPYGEVPEIENPPAYEDDNFTYTFAGWDPEVSKVTGDATYTATYDKTSKLKDIVINVNNADYGYFTYGDEEKKEFMLPAPLDCDAGVIVDNVLTFDFVIYEDGEEVPQTHVFAAFPNPDDTMHYEFVEWTVSEDGNTYTANFVTDIITSKDLDRIQTFFDYTKTEGGDVVFTLKSKDGLAIPKGTMTVWYYEIAYLEDIEDWVQIERSCDAIAMDWDEETYGDNLISMTIEYADLTQDGEAFDITSKTISTMWLVFDGVNGAHCESNKATPGQ